MTASLIPLPAYRSFEPEEMLERATSFREELARRRTVRDFSDRPVDLRIIEQCLLTAGTAPSGANLQPWRFVVITSPEFKHRIREAAEAEEREFYARRAPQEWKDALAPLGTDEHKSFLDEAPVLIAIFERKHSHLPDGRRVTSYYVTQSVGIATGMLIAAVHHAGSRIADPYAESDGFPDGGLRSRRRLSALPASGRRPSGGGRQGSRYPAQAIGRDCVVHFRCAMSALRAQAIGARQGQGLPVPARRVMRMRLN